MKLGSTADAMDSFLLKTKQKCNVSSLPVVQHVLVANRRFNLIEEEGWAGRLETSRLKTDPSMVRNIV